MIKKTGIILLMIIVIIISVFINKKQNIEEKDNKEEIGQAIQTQLINKELYSEQFELYLNEFKRNKDDLNINKEIFNESLFRPKVVENDIDSIEDVPMSHVPDEEIEIITEFPILDTYGNIARYGTQEESEQSIEFFNQQPVYEVLNTEYNGSILKLKIYNRERQRAQLFILNIVDSKIDSYNIYD